MDPKSISGPNNHVLADAIRKADGRSKAGRVDANARIFRRVSPASEVHQTGLRIDSFQPAVPAFHERVVSIFQAQSKRQFAAELPTVTHIPVKLRFTAGHIDVLQAFADNVRRSQEKRCERVERSGRSASRREISVEIVSQVSGTALRKLVVNVIG